MVNEAEETRRQMVAKNLKTLEKSRLKMLKLYDKWTVYEELSL